MDRANAKNQVMTEQDFKNKFTSADFTHYLRCSHCVGNHCRNYHMKCLILPSKSKKTKLLVFGERCWKGAEHIKKIRYVDSGFSLKENFKAMP